MAYAASRTGSRLFGRGGATACSCTCGHTRHVISTFYLTHPIVTASKRDGDGARMNHSERLGRFTPVIHVSLCCFAKCRTLAAASAFSQLGKARQAGALLPTRGYQQQHLSTSNRFLAGASASRGVVAHQFTTGAFPSRAAAGDGGGASGPELLIEGMKLKIHEGLEGGADFVDVVDISGDARHISIKVVAKAFEGKNAINRQRMVFKCIWEEMQTDKVHAVQAIETKTPDEAK